MRRRNAPLPARSAALPEEGVWLWGLHAVSAALRNPARRLRRLLVTRGAEAELAERAESPWRIKPEFVERDRLDRMLGGEAIHQGAALLVEALTPPALPQLMEQTTGPVLVLDQVTDPRNVGAILRSAAAFGAAAVLMQERHAPAETGTLARAASGALEVVPVLREVNLARAIESLKQAGLWVVGLEAAGPVTLAQSGLVGRRVALVLGAEGEGLRRLTRESCDELVRLPIRPAMESLNVSAAAAVALYELGRE
ncbi:23S rRNA (guanosine(2251)-2'-O)-methyltransferase RlmB [Sabulicella glaciei]|uniref:23S rRNA (Guanosine(2251)-2'-O)-methyltransferase RlmB n=1 Tax=Sabulicella glaciei TaxID=2984948 RepID=A0ABT3NS08_9PROT|nr:23S rRNA (guanosine(2251)-2'-O)-methyltransferase RlmB [Roseococcus sp. MDT2-1-1]MCW8084948.1 23S rRNA (guanosine(2251)-2'-O)-methyltransferase RlmB [Roseococcus sp. MDT2-1-1]